MANGHKKVRRKPELLTSLELLDRRMMLPYVEKQHLSTISKGYEGEVLFDSLMAKHLDTEAIVLNDLFLITGSTPFQIDSLLLTSDAIFLYEIKNYEGNYTNRTNQFLTSVGQEIVSPTNQLNRTATLFSKFLKKWNYTLPIESNVVFVNPYFMLYEAKDADPFIFPSQIEAHFSSVNRQSGPLSPKHHFQAQKLIEESQKELPYQRQLPFYDFEGLKKGLLCNRCGSFDLKNTTKMSHCQACGNTASVNNLFLSQVDEFKHLFPKEQVTRNIMHDWCGGMLPKRRITAILNAACKRKGYAKSSHYS